MNAITIVILVFSVLGAVDYVLGNKIGMGSEFQRAFSLFGPMALSVLGMIVIAPAIGVLLTPFCSWFYDLFGIDPSIIPCRFWQTIWEA
jgi:ethanolamine transporter